MHIQKQTAIQNEEIDLREIWIALVKHKATILVLTLITTLIATLYSLIVSPIYSGNVLISVGSVILNTEQTNDKPTIIQTIENTADLSKIIVREINVVSDKPTIKVSFPEGSTNLISISCESNNKNQIKHQLEEALKFVINRHQNKASFYKESNAKIFPSSIIGKIVINPEPIKPKKGIIITIGFISGLILGLFLAFFREFIIKNHDN